MGMRKTRDDDGTASDRCGSYGARALKNNLRDERRTYLWSVDGELRPATKPPSARNGLRCSMVSGPGAGALYDFFIYGA